MAAQIRLQLLVEPGSGAQAAIDGLGRSIDSSIQLAVQRANSQIDVLGNKIAQVASRMQRLNDSSIGKFAGDSAAASRLMSSQLDGLARVISRMGPSIATLTSQNQGLSSSFASVAAAIYTIKNIGGVIDSGLVSPIRAVAEEMINTTEQSRRFETAIAGMAGGMAKARDLNLDLAKASRDTAASWGELQRITQTQAFGPLAATIGLSSPASAAKEVSDFSSLISRLSLINPDATETQMSDAVRELVGGGRSRSLQRLIGFSPTSSGQSGVSQQQLAQNPGLALKSLENFADLFIPQSAADGMKDLLSTRMEKIRDALDFGLLQIGDRAYSTASKQLGRVAYQLFAEFSSPAFATRASSIADNLSKIVENAGGGLIAFAASLAGEQYDGDSVKMLTILTDDLFSTIGHWSEELKPIGRDIGETAHVFAVSMELIAQAAKNSTHASANSANAGSVAAGYAAIPIGNAIIPSGAGSAIAKTGDLLQDLLGRAATVAAAIPLAVVSDNNAVERVPASRVLTAPSAIPLLQSEWQGPPWAALMQASRGTLDRFGKEDAKVESPLEKIDSKATNLLGSNIGTAADPIVISDLFSRIDAITRDADIVLQRAINDQSAVVAANPGDHNLSGQLDYLNGLSTKLHTGSDTAANMLQEQLETSAKDYGVALTGALKGVSPRAALIIEQRIEDGTTSLASAVEKLLISAGRTVGDRAKALGSGGANLSQQLTEHGALISSGMAAIEQQKRFGTISIDTTGSQIMAMSPQNSFQNTQQQLAFLQSQLPQSLKDLANAQMALHGAGPVSEGGIALIVKAQEQVAGLSQKIRELKSVWDPLTQLFTDWSNSIQSAFTNRLGDAFDGLITGSKKLGDVLRGLESDIASSFAHLAATQLVNSVVGVPAIGNNPGSPGALGSLGISSLVGGLFSGIGHLFGGLGGSAAPAVAGGAFHPFSYDSFATGGIMTEHGRLPLNTYAGGGIANSPQLALFGEGRGPEAFVPLGSGGKIPVAMSGGGDTPEFHFYLVSSPELAVAQGLRQSSNRHYLIDTIAGDIKTGGKTQKAIRRRT
jgi:hypothetical protein